ncbi:MAG: hypothetical protein JWO80_2481 [Bryobacterales bacterium]|nr:hypothetical protein [Bryobacterales bacterium]
MLRLKYFAGVTLAAGMLLTGASIASAQDWRYNQPYSPYQYQNQYRDYNNRYDRREELEEHIARDRARLDEAIHCGRDADAARQAADLARDQRLLQEQTRAIGADPYYGSYNNRRYYNRGWSSSWGWR